MGSEPGQGRGQHPHVDATSAKVEAGRWYFVAGTYDGNLLRLYVDGELAGSSAIGAVTIDNTASPLTIGEMGSGFWGGAIDEVGLWADDLSSSQVADLHAAARRASADVALTTRTDHDGLGRPTLVTSPRGIRTAAVFDRLGRQIATVANLRDGTPASATSDDNVRSEFAVNALGELIGHCSAVQVHLGDCVPSDAGETQAWRYAFDAMGRQVSQTPPVNTTATALVMREWSYQPGGRLASIVDRSAGGGTIQRHTDFSHDALGRVTDETVYLGSGTGNPELAWTTTWNADGTRASRTIDDDDTNPQQVGDEWTFTYDDLGRPHEVKQGSTTVTDYAWNPSGTLASREDLGVAGTTTFTHDWAGRQIEVNAPSTFGSGEIDFSYGLDGLLAGRSTPNGVTASLDYDGAKRPTEVDFSGDSLSRAYDRDGNVTAEGRSLTGVSSDAGSGTATFTYDGLGRVMAMDGLARDDAFSYDRNGNRLSKTEGSATTTYTYDRTDQLVSQTIGATTTVFAYNAYGDLTNSADAFDESTAHGYDAAGRLVSLTPPGESASTYTYDALGRVTTRTTGSATLTYRYLGVGHVSYASVPGSGAATYSLVDAATNRLALDTGGTTAWTLFDPHGNLAGAQAEGSATVVSALRYDAYGQLLDGFAAGSGSTEMPWRFQGRLDVSPDTDEALYDFGARMYRPSAGTFTQLDTYAGTVQEPLSMNRFLYAHANPTTLVDPDGHAVPMIDGTYVVGYKPKPRPARSATPPGPVRVPPLLAEDAARTVGPVLILGAASIASGQRPSVVFRPVSSVAPAVRPMPTGPTNYWTGRAWEHTAVRDWASQFPVEDGWTVKFDSYLRNPQTRELVRAPLTNKLSRLDGIAVRGNEIRTAEASIGQPKSLAAKAAQLGRYARSLATLGAAAPDTLYVETAPAAQPKAGPWSRLSGAASRIAGPVMLVPIVLDAAVGRDPFDALRGQIRDIQLKQEPYSEEWNFWENMWNPACSYGCSG